MPWGEAMTTKNLKYTPLKFRLPIIEANRVVTLRVTDMMCRTGVRDDPSHCALALAGHAAFRGLRRVQVMRNVAYFEFPTYVEKFRTSAGARRAILKFDKTGEFAPGDYTFVGCSGMAERKKRNDGKYKRNGSQPAAGSRMRAKAIPPRGNGKIGWAP
jgi:hypothetical protein